MRSSPPRTRYDRFGKQLLRQALAPGGAVETDAEVPAETGRIDLWFLPDPEHGQPRTDLGLLGRLLAGPRTVELYHSTPSGAELDHAVIRHGLFRHVLSLREPAPPTPTQVVISSGRPATGIDGLCFHPRSSGPLGLYDGPSLLWTWLVVVNELEPVRDTLLLRLCGAGKVLRQAIAELEALPADAPERTLARPILLRLSFEIPADPNERTTDDQEFLMDTQDIVEKWRQEAIQEGVKQGLQEGVKQGHGRGVADALIDVYEARFGAMPAELRTVIDGTLDETVLRGWLKLVGVRSAEEIAAAIHASRAS